jgi:mono/diheme cytochrome c family protein
MNIKLLTEYSIFAVILSVLMVACGGSGGLGNNPNAPLVLAAVTGPNNFLKFPNQVLDASGVPEIDSEAYSNAYYAAVDPSGVKDTYAKWKVANGFGNAATGTEITVVVGDSRDLGYGRYITARKNVDGTMALSVRNYLVTAAAGYGYTSFNLDAAVAQDDRWYIGASNIEFSPGPNGGVSFAKFFFFAPDGSLAKAVNLDGRGTKWMPGPCITCHGGRADPLTPATASGVRLFPLVQNSASLTRGDVQGHMHPLEADSFEYSTQAGFTRAQQEAAIKQINTWILQSYPLPYAGGPIDGTLTPVGSSVTGFAEDDGRRIANKYEWQGTAASLIKDGYGGDGLPSATYTDAIPASWASVGQSSLYQNVVVPSCRVCHILRGAGTVLAGTDIDLNSYAKFNSYADQIKTHTIDSGNMPLAKIHFEKFWATPSIYETLANYLYLNAASSVRDASGAVVRPGRPIAEAGPSRTVNGATTLSGIASQYASSYLWSITSGVGTLTNETSRDANFIAPNGTYTVQLIASSGTVASTPSTMTIVVNNALNPDSATIRFAQIKAVLQDPAPTGCVFCHTTTKSLTNTIIPASLSNIAQTPVTYDIVDRNGDGVVDGIDDEWLYAEVRGRINFNDVADSPMLLKPAGKHHGGNPVAATFQPGFDTSLNPGATTGSLGNLGRKNYDLVLNWILNGAPY